MCGFLVAVCIFTYIYTILKYAQIFILKNNAKLTESYKSLPIVHLNGHTIPFYPRAEVQNHLAQHSKQHHRKNVLLSCLNYHILGFHPQTFRVKTAA